jgi:alpha-beta hydrolase superfamily lysophospholipase
MKSDTFTFVAEDGTKIFVHRWFPENIKAACQIAHGMAEHSARYERFARKLVDAGYAVYANDHRGHGKTAGEVKNLGYFADKNGWDLVVQDMHQLTEIIKENHKDIPVFLIGHSMGSLLSLDYLSRFGNDLKGALLSAPPENPGFLGNLGILLAKLECWRKGRETASPLLDKLTFGSFNKAFKPNRTDFDWLSRDDTEVDKYIGDPFCGTIFTAGFFVDLLTGVKKVNDAKMIATIPKDLSIYLIAGDKDPVVNDTKGVVQIKTALEKAEVADINLTLYPEARHEMLNEINRKEVYRDIVAWLEKVS